MTTVYKCSGKFTLSYININKKKKTNRAKSIEIRFESAHCMYMDTTSHISEVVRMLLIYIVMIRKPHTCIVNAVTYFSQLNQLNHIFFPTSTNCIVGNIYNKNKFSSVTMINTKSITLLFIEISKYFYSCTKSNTV